MAIGHILTSNAGGLRKKIAIFDQHLAFGWLVECPVWQQIGIVKECW